jgi:hypothetical protein
VNRALIAAVERWIAANRSRFYELVRQSLQDEPGDFLPEELGGDTLLRLRARVEVLKATGGTITGYGLSRYERVLELVTSTITELKALDATARRRAAA